jgi:hypothetical protein
MIIILFTSRSGMNEQTIIMEHLLIRETIHKYEARELRNMIILKIQNVHNHNTI